MSVTTKADLAPQGDGTSTQHTTCTLDCPDACTLEVTITDGRMTAVDAGPGNPLTNGWICAKVKRHGDRVYAPERVLSPLVRTGVKGDGAFAPASWEAALEVIAERMRTALDTRGPDSIVAFTYNSSAPEVAQSSLSEAFFAEIGATVVDQTICALTIDSAWQSVYGAMASAEPRDVQHSQLVVVWGANPTVSNTHFPPLVASAVRNGARVVVIDPRRTAMAKRADLHLAIRPGTDIVLAYALAALWQRDGLLAQGFLDQHSVGADQFLEAAAEWSPERASEVCGVSADDIESFARLWADTPKTMLRVGWGQERNSNGGAASRAVLALPVLVGSFGQLGSGVIGSTGSSVVDPQRRWPKVTQRQRRTVAMHQIGQWLAPDAGDPCQVLVIQGSNPVVMCPDQAAVIEALQRDDVFTVVHEQVMTDTARYADVVLPATTAFEISDAHSGYGGYVVSPVNAVIERVGESRSNDELGLSLATALGVGWHLDEVPEISLAIADRGPRVVDEPHQQFVDTAPPLGRAVLSDPEHGVPRYVPVASGQWPLTLISPASPKRINSMFGELQPSAIKVALNPADAVSRGISQGDQVGVVNDRGVVHAVAEISGDVRSGVVVMAKGVWLRDYDGGRGVNVLTPATGDPLANGACYNDARVEVRKR